ncbi:sigma factor-like helix-turn-helix DNA-binding protein [Kineosporia succinea]
MTNTLCATSDAGWRATCARCPGSPRTRPSATTPRSSASRRPRKPRRAGPARRAPPARAEREAVEYCALGRMATADVAELLGITEASVRSRLSPPGPACTP